MTGAMPSNELGYRPVRRVVRSMSLPPTRRLVTSTCLGQGTCLYRCSKERPGLQSSSGPIFTRACRRTAFSAASNLTARPSPVWRKSLAVRRFYFICRSSCTKALPRISRAEDITRWPPSTTTRWCSPAHTKSGSGGLPLGVVRFAEQ